MLRVSTDLGPENHFRYPNGAWYYVLVANMAMAGTSGPAVSAGYRAWVLTRTPVTMTRHGVKASVTGVQVISVMWALVAGLPGEPGTGARTETCVYRTILK
jgi:hypothetical protein